MLGVSPRDRSDFCTLPHSPCTQFSLSYSCSKTPNFLKMMNFFRHHFLLFDVDSLDHQRWGCRPRPAFPFATVLTISFILTANFAFHFRPVITEGWAFFTSGSQESRSFWKSRAFPNLYSSTSDNVGSLSFVDELYSAIFVKELGTPNHSFYKFTD